MCSNNLGLLLAEADCENQQCYKKEKQQIFNKIIYNKLQFTTIIVLIILQCCFVGVSSKSIQPKVRDINLYEIEIDDLQKFENVTLNSNILITCKYINPIWHKNGNILQTDRIRFPKIKKIDAGEYGCKSIKHPNWLNLTLSVFDDKDSQIIQSSTSKIILNKSLPKCKNMSILNEIYHTEGETVRLKCDCRDSPMPNITWTKNDIRLKNGKFRGYSVTLNNIQESDVGRYSCNVCNHVGCVEHPVAFLYIDYVLKNMEIQSQLSEKILSTDSDVDYLKNDEDIDGNTNFAYDTDDVQEDGQADTLNNEEIGDEDEENDDGGDGGDAGDDDDEEEEDDETFNSNTETTILLNHQKPNRSQNHNQTPSIASAQLPEGLPRFIKSYDFNKIYSKPSGNMVKMRCPSEGNPMPNITWTKDGAAISRSMGEVKTYKWNIVLEDLVPKDSGQYTCIVCNRFGCINFTSDLSVADRVNHKPLITDGPQNQTVIVGSNVTFPCVILSDLHKDMQWKFGPDNNYSNIKTEEDRTEELILANITHEMEGWYTCVAANSLGFSTAKAYLTVVDKIDKEPILAPINSNPVFTIVVVICLATFIIIMVAIMVIQFRKIKHEKLMKHRAMETVHQWTKKIIIVKSALDTANPEIMQIPIVKIEKQRTTLIQSPLANGNSNGGNGSGGGGGGGGGSEVTFNEYEFPLDSNWEFSRNQLSLGPTLGEGAFGRVVMAEAHGLIKNASSQIVAVKMVKEGHTDADMASLVREMEVMKMIGKHINIINLLGCCSQDGPLYVIVEYAPHGNLKDFLKKNRPTSEYEIGMPNAADAMGGERKEILQKDLISFAFQVARGMEYLASRRCIHRDLAARNVLVSDDYVVKIADFGLARDIQESEYYRKNTNGRLPIKWMAPESLRDKFYDTQSDVWSYGVLLWEIMTYGDQPYPQVYSTEHLYEFLREGSRMPKPVRCSLNIYMLMRQCWNWNSHERPTFTEIVENLDKILGATINEEYLDLGIQLLETPPSSDDDDDDEEDIDMVDGRLTSNNNINIVAQNSYHHNKHMHDIDDGYDAERMQSLMSLLR